MSVRVEGGPGVLLCVPAIEGNCSRWWPGCGRSACLHVAATEHPSKCLGRGNHWHWRECGGGTGLNPHKFFEAAARTGGSALSVGTAEAALGAIMKHLCASVSGTAQRLAHSEQEVDTQLPALA